MSDEQELVSKINRARSMKVLKDSPEFQSLIISTETSIFQTWSETDDGAIAKDQWHRIRAFRGMITEADKIIAAGVMAAKELQDHRKAEDLNFGARPLISTDVANKQRAGDGNNAA